MSKINKNRAGCRDVFRAFLVQNAVYEGSLEIPCIKHQEKIPRKLISFSKAIRSVEYDAWIHFYEDDAAFERLWNNPQKYLPILKRFQGVITPDFSLYRDMPLVMQQWNIYRSRALGHWLQENGISVITNIRWGDNRTFEVACYGAPKMSTISIGSHGCIKIKTERQFFEDGLDYIIQTLSPQTIVVYGAAPNYIFGKYHQLGINIIQFDSDCAINHKKVVSA